MVSDYFKLFCKKKKRNLIEELGTPPWGRKEGCRGVLEISSGPEANDS